MTWSPKSNELLVLSSEVGSAWYQTLISTIDSVDLDTGAMKPITKRSQIVSYPIWAPDGSRFAFAEGNHTIQMRSMNRGDNLDRGSAGYLSLSDLVSGQQHSDRTGTFPRTGIVDHPVCNRWRSSRFPAHF